MKSKRTLAAFPTAPAALPSLLLALLSFAASPAAEAADASRAELKETALSVSALQPGKPATAAVVLEIKPGYHAQSRTPSEDFYIKFDAKVNENPALSFGEIAYPAGEVHTYPQLGRLNVYTGTVVLRFPVEVKADAPLGPTKITGKLRYQLCDDAVCYPPESAAFEIGTEIVGPGERVTPTRGDMFPATAPATAPAAPQQSDTSSGPGDAVAPPPAAKVNTVLGFELKSDAYLLPFAAAFLVGIIFNVMPCVLPVVPLKAMGFYEVSQHNRARSLAFGAVFSLGLIASFAALGLLIFVLQALDWGGLFQNFYFRLAIVLILLAMAVGTFGAFNVNLPSAVYSFSPRHDTYFGNFLYGILTAALSTPCTFGMFVALLAWASTRPAGVGMALLTMVGVGMASPYFVLSAFPEVARRFPRSGPWAETVKKFMAFLLLAMALYFAKPFVEKLVRPSVFWWLLFAVIVAAGVLLVVRTFRYARTAWGPAVGVAIALLLVTPSFFIIRQLAVERYQWMPYSDLALEQARSGNRVALVEFTADWCGNCHWLEANVLNRDDVVKAVDRNDVVMLKADVTDVEAEEQEAQKLLSRYSPKASIPLTLIYSPNLREPIQLTGIYSRQDLISAIERAANAKSELASQ